MRSYFDNRTVSVAWAEAREFDRWQLSRVVLCFARKKRRRRHERKEGAPKRPGNEERWIIAMAYVLWRVFMKKYCKVRLGIRNLPVSVAHTPCFVIWRRARAVLVYARACTRLFEIQICISNRVKPPLGTGFHRYNLRTHEHAAGIVTLKVRILRANRTALRVK